jgi:hypothetical protein
MTGFLIVVGLIWLVAYGIGKERGWREAEKRAMRRVERNLTAHYGLYG